MEVEGGALLDAAATLERRLAACGSGGGSSSGGGGGWEGLQRTSSSEGDASYEQELLVASLLSQLDPGSTADGTADGTVAEGGDRGATSAGGEAGPRRGGSSSGGSSVVGLAVAARAFVSPSFEGLFRGPQAAARGIVPTAICKFLGIAAVGTSSGGTHVLLPAPSGAGGGSVSGGAAPPPRTPAGGLPPTRP